MQAFLTALLGGLPLLDFLVLLFWALLGAFVSLLLHTTTRDIWSYRSPKPFDWAFLLCDNLRRIFITLVLIVIAIRFTPQLFGFEVNAFIALAIGLGNDRIAIRIKDTVRELKQKKKTTPA